jgi:hypothetical protein
MQALHVYAKDISNASASESAYHPQFRTGETATVQPCGLTRGGGRLTLEEAMQSCVAQTRRIRGLPTSLGGRDKLF